MGDAVQGASCSVACRLVHSLTSVMHYRQTCARVARLFLRRCCAAANPREASVLIQSGDLIKSELSGAEMCWRCVLSAGLRVRW